MPSDFPSQNRDSMGFDFQRIYTRSSKRGCSSRFRHASFMHKINQETMNFPGIVSMRSDYVFKLIRIGIQIV